MRTIRVLAVAALSAGLALIAPQPSSAGPSVPDSPPVVVNATLAAPFNLAIAGGKVYVADGGLNLVGKLGRGGDLITLAADQPGASGIAVKGRTIAFTTTVTEPGTFYNSESGLNILGAKGKRAYVDLHAVETNRNPDQVNSYGIENPSQCVIDALGDIGFPVSYTGAVDSHAYSVVAHGRNWIVADAGANVLWQVSGRGHVRTLAVLPPQPAVITAEGAAALQLPDCVVGVTYAFEPVPTDVEVGRDGFLYVTTLPGGPESPALGARGSLWRVNPFTGRAKLITSGLLGATNLAIGKHGTIHVAELFAGRIATIKGGTVRGYTPLPGVVAVETGPRGQLWAATLGNENPPAPGTIVRVPGSRDRVVARDR
jgi:hypothetical protein